jgi:RNA polymerase sigma-70 factor (family 1)
MKNDLDDLVSRLKQDDKEAFNMLFYLYAEKLHKFSLTFFIGEAEAEEVVQDVFVKIWLKRYTIHDPKTFNSFIYTIAKNLIYNNLKRSVYRRKYEHYQMHNLREGHNDLENEMIYSEMKIRLEAALAQLPKKRREIFILSRNEGLKNREIAEKLDISIKTVETQMSLTLKYLKEIFKTDIDTFFGH